MYTLSLSSLSSLSLFHFNHLPIPPWRRMVKRSSSSDDDNHTRLSSSSSSVVLLLSSEEDVVVAVVFVLSLFGSLFLDLFLKFQRGDPFHPINS